MHQSIQYMPGTFPEQSHPQSLMGCLSWRPSSTLEFLVPAPKMDLDGSRVPALRNCLLFSSHLSTSPRFLSFPTLLIPPAPLPFASFPPLSFALSPDISPIYNQSTGTSCAALSGRAERTHLHFCPPPPYSSLPQLFFHHLLGFRHICNWQQIGSCF